jgi:hypothetical protein
MVLALQGRGKQFKFVGDHGAGAVKRNRHHQSDGRCEKREFYSGPTGLGGEERPE